jgi:hypothetical protein
MAKRSPVDTDARHRLVARGAVRGPTAPRKSSRPRPAGIAERDQHRRPEVLPRPARLTHSRAVGQADDHPRRRNDRSWRRERGYFAADEDADAFETELTYILLHQMAAFNSPVWFNVGWHPVGSPKMQACFLLSVEDNMESILEWNNK